jgi:cell division transport system permease protein
MFIRYLPYFLKQALKGIFETPLLHLVAVGIISISIVIFGAFLIILHNADLWMENLGSRIQITIYLKKGLSRDEIDIIRDLIKGYQEVKSVHFISEKEALARLKAELGPHSGVIEGLDENPLPPSFEVVLKEKYMDLDTMRNIAMRIKGLRQIDEVLYGQEWAKRLSQFIRLLKMVGIVIGGLLLLAVIFIVANTVRLTVLNRMEEIEIMRLVGATEGFIRAPLIIEGMIQGLSGSLFAIGILYILHILFTPVVVLQTQAALGGIQISFLPLEMLIQITAGGTIVGIFGSLISMIRFMKR